MKIKTLVMFQAGICVVEAWVETVRVKMLRTMRRRAVEAARAIVVVGGLMGMI